jgi:DNA repair exonuclease SbcCD nuclease subunit
MPTEILHTADTHIGYRQYHRPEREEDFRSAFELVVTEAIENDVDAVVHAGDLFDRSRPSIGALSDAVTQLKRLNDAGIEFCTIVGNHDGTRDRQWPEFFQSLGLAVYLDYNGHQIGDIVFYGQDYVDQSRRKKLKYQFQPTEAETAVLVAHGLFTPFPHGRWDSERLMAKATVKFNALLLGDDHTPQIDNVDGVPITYPGSTERTAADQREGRAYNLITFDDGVTIHQKPLSTRKFYYIDVELEPDDGVDHVLSILETETVPDGAVAVVTITGSGKRVAPADIERSGYLDSALVVRVNDQREFEDDDRDYSKVNFADPDDAVRERKQALGLSPVANDMEQLARALDKIPKSNLKDTAESRVTDSIEEQPLDDFEKRDGEDTSSDNPASSPGPSQDPASKGAIPPDEPTEYTPSTRPPNSKSDSNPGPDDEVDHESESTGQTDPIDSGQMQLEDIDTQ